jgi:ABC-type polysaccharide/polyol phosphate export permease
MSEHEKNVSKLCKKFKKMIYYVSIILYANFHWKSPIKSYIVCNPFAEICCIMTKLMLQKYIPIQDWIHFLGKVYQHFNTLRCESPLITHFHP